jgi:signal transduction histidine kinase
LNKKIINILILCNIFCYSSFGVAQVKQPQIIGAYVYNFAQYTNWPDEDNLSEFNITLVSEDKDLIVEFKKIADNLLVKNKPISLKVLKRPKNSILNAQLVFVSAEKLHSYLDIFDIIEGKPVLIVTNNYNDKRYLMYNLVDLSGDKIGFEINNANIINQGLTVSPDIILLGGTQVDVAKLYHESQTSLRELELQINSSNQLIENQKNLINNQNTEIDSHRIALEEVLSETNIAQEALEYQSNLLSQREIEIREQQSEIDIRTNILSRQNAVIDSQETAIQSYVQTSKQQNIIISSQKNILYLLGVIILLVLVLIVSIYKGYKHKKDTNIKLEELDRLKSSFMASMSHELRTPLNSIIGFTGMMLMGITGKLNKEQKTQLALVKNSSQHLLDLINEILDISKIEAGKTTILPEEFEINEVVNDLVSTLSPLAKAKDIQLVHYFPEVIPLFSDKKRVKQIIMNLTSNSIKFTDKGKISIRGKTLNKSQLEIRVIDTGMGIKKEDMDKLFGFFQQLDMSSKKKEQGTGLGLYLSQKLAHLLGGNIIAKSEYGVGSEFVFTFPLKYSEHKVVK